MKFLTKELESKLFSEELVSAAKDRAAIDSTESEIERAAQRANPNIILTDEVRGLSC